MAKSRRGFLKGAAAALASVPIAAEAQNAASPTAPPAPPGTTPASPAVRPPNAAERAAETGADLASADVQIIERPGSDYMVDVIKSLPVEYILASPGSSFRSLHESIVNYGGNKPEFITCTHEEIGVAMGNGYAKIEGK